MLILFLLLCRCGKTTQIPQFISECNPNLKIVVCQPRRLAAVGVATRVAEEMDSKMLGSDSPRGNISSSSMSGDGLVGYMVRGDCKVSANTNMVFCTYGVLLRRLQEDPTLQAINVIILDEIHGTLILKLGLKSC